MLPRSHPRFVHLHTHSDYSLLDGAARIDRLVDQAAEYEMPALALTDHGVMYGAIEFYETALKKGVKPIVGCEVYVAPGSRFEKTSRGSESPYHLVLLAENQQGYQNLMRLVSLGFLEGFYYKPRVDKELLSQYAKGLLALSGCVKGEIARCVEAGDAEAASRAASELRDMFGKESFYLELQEQGLTGQDKINEGLLKLGKKLDIPALVTNDVHYVKRSDAAAHDVLLCIQTGSVLAEDDRLKFATEEFYLKPAAQMAERFPGRTTLLERTLEVAERCNLKLDFDRALLPQYEVPKGQTLDSYLEELCEEGLRRRFPEPSSEVTDRLRYELEVIKKIGFSGYFLVVSDFVRYARERGIRVGPGRGSAAGSVVAYVLGITNVNPLDHGLLFERFLNPERVSMPDIDIDFSDDRREEVIEYVAQKYGAENVAQVITFTTMQARAATRDAGRVFDIPYGRVDKIAKMIPEGQVEGRHGEGKSIEHALQTVPELRQAYETDDVTRRILDTAQALVGLVRQDSVHAAGVVIADRPLNEYAPTQRKGEGETVTQYDMNAIRRIGLLKIDFLGLRTLTVIDNACHNIRRIRGIEIDPDDLPENDPNTFELLRKGDTIGVFQLESTGMRSLLRELRPTRFADIVALLALYRPGPLGSGMVKDFCDRKNGRQQISYLHPALEPVLQETYGIMVYQEQVMRIASDVAGFTMAEADILRGAMSKKLPKVIVEQREKFLAGAVANGIDEETAGKIFDLVLHFAGYGFNRSHSCAYAVVSYQTAYLKANYPVEFMAALLTSVMGNKDKVAQYVNECRRLGIQVLPPDVDESERDFIPVDGTVEGAADRAVDGTTAVTADRQAADAIRFGLSAVRNVGEGAIESIIAERARGGRFKSIFDFCRRVDLGQVNKKALESLIRAGAFDSCGMTRKRLMFCYEKAADSGVRSQKDKASGQSTIFDVNGDTQDVFEEAFAEVADEYEKAELLAYEKEMLGLYVSDHPLLGMEEALRAQTQHSVGDLIELKDGTTSIIGGIVTHASRSTTKKGDLMLFLTLEDLDGALEVIAFPSIYQKYRELLEEDSIIRIKGRLDRQGDTGAAKFIAQDVAKLEKDAPEGKRRAGAAGRRAASSRSAPRPAARPEPTSRAARRPSTAPGVASKRDSEGPPAVETEPARATVEGQEGEPGPTLHISLSPDALQRSLLDDLKSLFSANPGHTPVLVRVRDGSRVFTLSLGEGYRVEARDELLAALERLVGRESVDLRQAN